MWWELKYFKNLKRFCTYGRHLGHTSTNRNVISANLLNSYICILCMYFFRSRLKECARVMASKSLSTKIKRFFCTLFSKRLFRIMMENYTFVFKSGSNFYIYQKFSLEVLNYLFVPDSHQNLEPLRELEIQSLKLTNIFVPPIVIIPDYWSSVSKNPGKSVEFSKSRSFPAFHMLLYTNVVWYGRGRKTIVSDDT